MREPQRPTLADLEWTREFPVYGLADDFTGGRWLDGTGSDQDGPNALALGHGGPLRNEGPHLVVGFQGILRHAAYGGRLDMTGTLASALVNAANEDQYLACDTYEQRKVLARHLEDTAVRAVKWKDAEFTIDGEPHAFSCAEIGTDHWVAVSEFSNAFIWMHAKQWKSDPRPRLTRIQDLSPYL